MKYCGECGPFFMICLQNYFYQIQLSVLVSIDVNYHLHISLSIIGVQFVLPVFVKHEIESHHQTTPFIKSIFDRGRP
ncbi:hypothetical protein QR98_0039970 [Sarcoptes scabiei]|uniref:Uncharacterized protein n=1 Tax=Sarcoptes scabiei TaxID=52283 RepID=A0A132A3F6_SARSC|nr:hypothetical protein QR98_0039970 [Sarcoptes scabiei]